MELLHLDLVERDQVVGRNHQVVKDLVEEDLDEEVVEEDPVENVLAEKDLAEDEDEFLKIVKETSNSIEENREKVIKNICNFDYKSFTMIMYL